MNSNYLSLEELRRRLGTTTDNFLFSLTPQQRNAMCDLRTRARMEPKFSGFPLLRVQDVEAWVAERWR